MALNKIWISLLFIVGCTSNQQRKISELVAPINHSHNIKIIRESLDRPSPIFSIHLIPGKDAYILKGNHLPVNERFLFASIDGASGKIDLLYEFECLSDGSIKVFDAKGPYYENSLSFLVHETVLVGKQIDYVLARKKDCTFAAANFLPYPIQVKGANGERVSLLVTHPMLTRFSLMGSGFGPSEQVRLIHRSGDRIETLDAQTDEMGRLETTLNPTILGKLGGDASLTIIREDSSIDLEYAWGTKLENRTFAEHRTFPILFAANLLPHEMDRDPLINPFFSVN